MKKKEMNIYPPFPKRIFYIGMSIFLIFQSDKLVLALLAFENLSIGIQIGAAFLINLFITGIFAFAGFALPTEKLMPASYYKIHQPKQVKSWYQKSGTATFRKFLLVTVWRDKEFQKTFFDGTIDGIQTFETQTKKSEFGHLIPFICITVLCVFFIKTKMWILIFVTMLINIIFNFYPIILQRHHRMRLARFKKILAAKNRK